MLLKMMSKILGFSLLIASCTGGNSSGVKAVSRGGVWGQVGGEKMPLINLRCEPFKGHDYRGHLEGTLLGVGLAPNGYAIGGQVELALYGEGKGTQNLSASLSGTYVPPSRDEAHKTNYIDAKIFGVNQLSGVSLSLYPQSADYPMSAIYDVDGYRFGMDCSKSEVSFN